MIAVIAGNLVSILLAFLLDAKLKAKNFFRTIFFIPNTMSLLVVGYIWYFVYTKVLPEMTKTISGNFSIGYCWNMECSWILYGDIYCWFTEYFR